MFSAFSAFANDDDLVVETAPEAVETAAPVETEAPVVTDAPTEAVQTEPPTQAVQTEPPTEAPTQAPQTAAPTQAAPVATDEPTEPPTSANEDDYLDLPDSIMEEEPTAARIIQGEDGDLTYGYISWGCVAVGVLAVLIVIISNKTGRNGGDGKHRYGEGDKLSGQSHLVGDEYYKNRARASYYRKDTRR